MTTDTEMIISDTDVAEPVPKKRKVADTENEQESTQMDDIGEPEEKEINESEKSESNKTRFERQEAILEQKKLRAKNLEYIEKREQQMNEHGIANFDGYDELVEWEYEGDISTFN